MGAALIGRLRCCLRCYAPPAIAARLEARHDDARLNVRETQILKEIHRGSTSDEIARTLGLTAGTVRVYMTALLAKLGRATAPRPSRARSRRAPSARRGDAARVG